MKKQKQEKFISVREYAALCEVTPATILSRIKSKVISEYNQGLGQTDPIFIDVIKFPPQKQLKSGRKPLAN